MYFPCFVGLNIASAVNRAPEHVDDAPKHAGPDGDADAVTRASYGGAARKTLRRVKSDAAHNAG